MFLDLVIITFHMSEPLLTNVPGFSNHRIKHIRAFVSHILL